MKDDDMTKVEMPRLSQTVGSILASTIGEKAVHDGAEGMAATLV